MMPVLVDEAGIFAMPKSVILGEPSGSTMMLAGLMSRWMMPRLPAWSSAAQIGSKSASASSTGSGPRLRITEASVWPSMNSIAIAVVGPSSITS